jgi:hypothetical protein
LTYYFISVVCFYINSKKGGERVNAGKEKSSNEKESNKEDRKKEEISFLYHVHTHFGLGKIFSSLFLFSSLVAVFSYYKTPFLRKIQDNFITLYKITINSTMQLLIDSAVIFY